MRMHSRLLHGALQKEETRAIVIEVEDGPEEPGEDEEFYAANFEILGQEDEDENEEATSSDVQILSRYVTAINHFEFIFLLYAMQALERWQKK